jgi:hypothetical protein
MAKEKTRENMYKIYTRWLAVGLRKAGFKIIGTDVNEYHPEFTVWLFENTDELRECIKKLSAEHRAPREEPIKEETGAE